MDARYGFQPEIFSMKVCRSNHSILLFVGGDNIRSILQWNTMVEEPVNSNKIYVLDARPCRRQLKLRYFL